MNVIIEDKDLELLFNHQSSKKYKKLAKDITQDHYGNKKLESTLGFDAKFWLDYQHNYDTWPERRAAYEAAHPEAPRSSQ